MVHREAVQLPIASGCTPRRFLRALSPSPGPRGDNPPLRAARAEDRERGLGFSLSTAAEKNGYTQVLFTVWPGETTDSALLSSMRKQENGLLSLDVMEKVRTSLREVVTDCRAATVVAGRGPAPQEVVWGPKATCITQDQSWSGAERTFPKQSIGNPTPS